MRDTGNPHSDDKEYDADDTEFAELVAAQQAQDGHAGERQEAEAKADDISRVRHLAVPSVCSVQLLGRSHVQKQVPQRCLQSVEGKVEKIEGYNGKCDCGILDLASGQAGTVVT